MPPQAIPKAFEVVRSRPVDLSDLKSIVELINACFEADQLDRHITLEDLKSNLDHPRLDREHDLRLWEDGDRHLIAYAELWIDAELKSPLEANLAFQIHPHARHSDVPAQLLGWAEDRMRQIGRDRNVAVALRGSSRDSQTDRIQLLERSGFVADRWFHTMGRSLINTAIEQPPCPAGFTIRPVNALAEATAWVEMFNQSFIDHWNHHDLTVEEFCHEVEHDPNYKPQLDLVAIAPDGTFAGFCVANIHTADNLHRNCREGWIGLLGTRRGFRRQGLGRALLLSGLQRLQQHGMEFAKIGVDSQNPNQAFALYKSIGFQCLYTSPTFIKPL